MVGGGHVAQRRVPQLIAAGADVVLVSPEVTPAVEGLATAGEITWHQRGFEDADLDGAWYVIAATDDPAVNEAVSARRGAAPDLLRPRRRRDPGHAPGRRRSAGTPASPSPCSATASRAAAPRVRDEILEGLREGTHRRPAPARPRRPAWCWSAAAPATPS